jgi:restriction endonuclease S subunit
MTVSLSDISKLQFGYYTKPLDSGEIMYLQAKHFDEFGNQMQNIDTWIDTDSKNIGHILEDGDVLFVGKGMRNFAWTYKSLIGQAIASSIFFVIRPDKTKVIPEYITTLFNTPKYQLMFHTMGAGSSIPSIRKSELEAINIELPSLEVQKQIVEINQLHVEDIDVSNKIIAEKKVLFQAVINKLINQ